MANKLTDEDIGKIIARAISQTKDYTDNKLSAERQEVLKYYNGELPGPMFKGDSSHVSRDVHDVVNAMRADIEESFSAHNRVVEFEADYNHTADDSKQATNYCRQTFFKENDGSDVMYTTITDGLLARIGVVKVYYDEEIEVEEYEFEDVTVAEADILVTSLSKPEIDSESLTLNEDGTYSGVVKNNVSNKKIVVENIQPENFLIENNAISVEKAKFVAHRVKKTRSWFVENYGEDVAEDIDYRNDEDVNDTLERTMRRDFAYTDDDLELDDSQMEATLYECYALLDVDGIGTSKLWKVNYCSGKVLDKERVAFKPFAVFVPLPIPHTFIGENYAHSIIPIQKAKTVSYRQTLNHNLMTSNPRYMVESNGLMNPAELLDNRFGGVVNVRNMNSIAPLPTPNLNPYIMPFLGMLNEDKEQLSGITKLSQGMNKDALSTQNAEGKVEMLMSAAQTKRKVIGRKFGDFMKDIFYLIYNTAIDYVDQETLVEVSGVQAEVNPSAWKRRNPATVQLTLGYAERDQKAMELQNLHMALSQDPSFQGQYTQAGKDKLVRQILELRGIPDTESILMPLDQVEPPQPDPMQEIAMQREQLSLQHLQKQIEQMDIRAQIELLEAQTKADIAATKRMAVEIDNARVGNAMEVAQGKLALEAQRTEATIWKEEQEVMLAAQAEQQTAIFNP